jgi:cytochrome c biogenesis protein CcmG, thiol:disulfide interchange protein DsbE
MKINLIIIGTIILVAFLYGGYDMYMPADMMINKVEPKDTKIDKTNWKDVPDFTFTTIEGKKLSMHDFKGKVVIVNFWATWCPTCITAFPKDVEAVKKYNGDVIFIGVSSDDNVAEINKFVNKQNPEIKETLKASYVHIFLDENREITKNIFHTERYPETIILSKDMKMAKKLVGDIDWNSPQLLKFIGSL